MLPTPARQTFGKQAATGFLIHPVPDDAFILVGIVENEQRDNGRMGPVGDYDRDQGERTQHLNEEGVRKGDYVLYWMQSYQRAEHNHTLEYAVQRTNELFQRLLVVFGLTEGYPGFAF